MKIGMYVLIKSTSLRKARAVEEEAYMNFVAYMEVIEVVSVTS